MGPRMRCDRTALRPVDQYLVPQGRGCPLKLRGEERTSAQQPKMLMRRFNVASDDVTAMYLFNAVVALLRTPTKPRYPRWMGGSGSRWRLAKVKLAGARVGHLGVR